MSELRWILLAIGVVVVGAIYFLWGRDLGWRPRPRLDEDAAPPQRKEPVYSAVERADLGERTVPTPAADIPVADSESSPPASAKQEDSDEAKQGPQKIVALHVASRGSVPFNGEEIVAALQAENMELGKFEIFHRLDSVSSKSLFSAASMVEPGTFDMAKLDQIATPGISLFLVLPGPIDGAEAFSEMLIAARNLAQRLGAEVLDDQGSSLSNQTAEHIREQILSFQLRIRSLDDVRA